jgi:hypothetical protein
MIRKIGIGMVGILAGSLLFPLSSCMIGGEIDSGSLSGSFLTGSEDNSAENKDSVQTNGILRAVGETLENEKGEEVILRGVNAGGLFVTENWMNGFAYSSAEDSDIYAHDFRSISKVWITRFGEEKAEALWKEYRENWWSEKDFKNCAEMGMNVIRLPFTYMDVDFSAVNGFDGERTYDFTEIDAFVQTAAEYGIYTILDLHGAYGSQNGKDHSGEVVADSDVDFYSNEEKQRLTTDLWGAIAEHYKDEPAVAGYDLLNEPAESIGSGTDVTSERHWAFLDKAYRAVRERDSEHVVIFESCWDGENLPLPSEYGWENCMYSFHHYSSCTGSERYTEHGTGFNEKVAGITSQQFGVPIYMGEFTCYDNEEQWEYTLSMLNRLGWSWTSWTYKLNSTAKNSPWGIVSIPVAQEDKINAHTDPYDVIQEKIAKLKTTEDIKKYTFTSGNTLAKVITAYCKAATAEKTAEGSYVFFDSETGLPLTFLDEQTIGEKVVACVKGKNDGMEIVITDRSEGDGSVTLSLGGKNLGVYADNGDYYVGVTGKNGKAERFYPTETEDGTIFISYTTCRYLYLKDGVLHADGRRAEATSFVCGHY